MIEFNDTLSQITPENIEYIMTKKLLDLYLESLHDAISNIIHIDQTQAKSHNDFFSLL